jgi:putative FmdB family regulatory protein
MPIYEYLCSQCGQVFEQLVLRSDAPVGCPCCPGAPVEKLFSSFSHQGDRGFAGAGAGGG